MPPTAAPRRPGLQGDRPGGAGPAPRRSRRRGVRPWLDLIASETARGKRFMRVRCVSVPFSDYVRFGLAGVDTNISAGEDIRYLERSEYDRHGLPNQDVWMFDSARLTILRFDGDDILADVETITEPETVLRHCQWRDAAWHYAMSPHDFLARYGR